MAATQTEVFAPGPCGDCVHAARCAERLMACETFADFVEARPRVSRGTHRARFTGERIPSRELFTKIYGAAEAA